MAKSPPPKRSAKATTKTAPRPQAKPAAKATAKAAKSNYVLDDQIGFILRQVWQRHTMIFARDIGSNLTPTQWAALSKLVETGPCSQNQLGRFTAMDVATIKGVIDRLTARGLTETSPDPQDGRRLLVSLTRAGQQLAEKTAPLALAISKETLAPLDARERESLLSLLSRLK
ncbi:MarR family winged helix-turn-helix transcriptional regulator [Bradyrhizobium oligotrophicum]|uniref:MarR family winged helix-turn-helix transcriptional regulator n=1 Tax=Bradyrhizobium oligotrophicum TaxID=44255 RepID=UPI003EBCD76A